jgi:hypothetical protein
MSLSTPSTFARTNRIFCALSIACALSLAGCEDSHDDCDEQGDEGHLHNVPGGCGLQENCTDTVDLAVGLRAEGEDSVFTVEVVSFDPLSVEDNEIIVAIETADGDPVTDAQVEGNVFSVDCMHFGPNPPEQVAANADGNYKLTLTHAHGGPWDTVIAIERGGESDEARLHLCVPGEEHGDGGMAEEDEPAPHCH